MKSFKDLDFQEHARHTEVGSGEPLGAATCSVSCYEWKGIAQQLVSCINLMDRHCENLHHGKKDQHGFALVCPVEARIEAALEKYGEMMQR